MAERTFWISWEMASVMAQELGDWVWEWGDLGLLRNFVGDADANQGIVIV
jgi:hypothetical protein